MSDKANTLANGADLNKETLADFVKRLHHDTKGEGVRDHCTADAIFIVQARRFIFGIDLDYDAKKVVIVEDSHWEFPADYWEDLDDEGQAELNALATEEKGFECDFEDLDEGEQWDMLAEQEDHTVTGMSETWEYVNSHFTKAAAERFIKRKRHDYRDGIRVYVDAQTYCWEFNTIKEAFLSGALTVAESKKANEATDVEVTA
ncbi:hypothetical protein [Sansalvadorimonas verongulae]|uniref:hypothetical protein n=1 Tax=Sansalvadorimonas verongulae TaxID=2172824 RepID=UPI0012BCBBF2|nr:hypothetical protein [Sansalvadorimonas verongulae]MTI12134.1 hypothetical protein [Sansalvadorimonas verongulae]